MSSSDSCLVSKLKYYSDLSVDDEKLVARFEESDTNLEKGESLYQGGDQSGKLYAVKSGWLLSSTLLYDGRRQVLGIHFPGDIIGFDNLPFEHAIHDANAATKACVCPFPKAHLDKVFTESPKLSALLWSVSLVSSSTYMDKIRVLGRMNASERLSYLLLEIKSRLRITSALGDDGSFNFPLSQSDVGDCIGLTNVYVSKTFTELVRRGWIKRSGTRITIVDEDSLSEEIEFHDRYAAMDTSWFPGN